VAVIQVVETSTATFNAHLETRILDKLP